MKQGAGGQGGSKWHKSALAASTMYLTCGLEDVSGILFKSLELRSDVSYTVITITCWLLFGSTPACMFISVARSATFKHKQQLIKSH